MAAASGTLPAGTLGAGMRPAPLGATVERAAQEAYVNGMSEVLLVSAALMAIGAVLMALFLPARAAKQEVAEPASPRYAGVAS